jgi:hypothetical protein
MVSGLLEIQTHSAEPKDASTSPSRLEAQRQARDAGSQVDARLAVRGVRLVAVRGAGAAIAAKLETQPLQATTQWILTPHRATP